MMENTMALDSVQHELDRLYRTVVASVRWCSLPVFSPREHVKTD